MAYGICHLKPKDLNEITLNELIAMTNAITNFELMKIGKYKPKRSKEALKADLEFFKGKINEYNKNN